MLPKNFPGRKASRQKVALSLLKARKPKDNEKAQERRVEELMALEKALEKSGHMTKSKKDRSAFASPFTKK